jgi:hypothetical protein
MILAKMNIDHRSLKFILFFSKFLAVLTTTEIFIGLFYLFQSSLMVIKNGTVNNDPFEKAHYFFSAVLYLDLT